MIKKLKYDLVVFGGGTSGIAAAYIASKLGINTLLIEKSDVLGGAITQGLVIPSMKVNTENINTDFFNDLKTFADKYNARHTYIDGNEAWFNPELLKIVFDDMLTSVNCHILFSSEPCCIKYSSKTGIFNSEISHKLLSLYIESKYIIDATAQGKIFKLLNCEFQNSENKFQNPGLRFIMSGINIETFSNWLLEIDKDINVTTVEKTDRGIYLSTAYTWDISRKWALAPLFKEAVRLKVLEYSDTAYFQVFSIPKMPDALAFNCPRIIFKNNGDINDPFVYSSALIQGRQRIIRIAAFCKRFLPGFKDAYISNISDILGIRESVRIKGKCITKYSDLLSDKIPCNPALACDYPIDIHSDKPQNDKLIFSKHTYYLPVESLISSKFDNLYATGRILSADFEAQSALRTQQSCFSMGEAAAKDIYKKLNH